MKLETLPLARGARWVGYAPASIGGLAVAATHRPGPVALPLPEAARARAIAAAIAEGRLPGVHDGKRFALVGAGAPAGEGDGGSLVLRFCDSSYAAFLATNGWDARRLAPLGRAVAGSDPRPAYRDLEPQALLRSGFLNCLGACLFVVVEREGRPFTYLTRRRGGNLAGYWDGSVDEGLSRADGTDLARFLARAAREEAGLEDPVARVLAAGHDTWSLQPALVGWVDGGRDEAAFLRRLERAPGRAEIADLRWVALEPQAVGSLLAELKAEGRVLPWVEIGLALLLRHRWRSSAAR